MALIIWDWSTKEDNVLIGGTVDTGEASLLRRLASEPPLTSGWAAGRGGAGPFGGSCTDTLRRIAPTTLVALSETHRSIRSRLT
jgi:hypothetical protein